MYKLQSAVGILVDHLHAAFLSWVRLPPLEALCLAGVCGACWRMLYVLVAVATVH